MASTSGSVTSLAWLWVIEYIAKFKLADASILLELIETAPGLTENLDKNMREMIALSCLEDLFDSSQELMDAGPSEPDQKVTFEFSESCEHVLQTILLETSLAELKMAGPALLKWDVHPFIMHKRASIPKCALEQLGDSIPEGTHPYAASLEGLSGLVRTSVKDASVPAGCGDLNSPTMRINGSCPDGNSTALPLENENRVVGNNLHDMNSLPFKKDRSDLAIQNLAGDSHGNQGCLDDGDYLSSNSNRFRQNASCANRPSDQILIPLPRMEAVEDSWMVGDTEKVNYRVEEEYKVGGLGEKSTLENDHDELAAVQRLGQIHVDGVGEFGHNHYDTAYDTNKLLQDTFTNGPQQYILMDEANDAEPRLSSGASSVGTKLGCRVEEESKVGGLGEKSSLENDSDELVAVNRLGQSHVEGVGEFWHKHYDNAYDTNKLLQDTFTDRPQQQILVDEANDAEPRLSSGASSLRTQINIFVAETKDNVDHDNPLKLPNTASLSGLHRKVNVDETGGVEHVCEEDTSSDSHKHDYDYERVDDAIKKSHFLSSQCTSHNFLETNCIDQNLCLKCGKDGDMLVCRGVGCPLVVHHSCLNSLAKVDEGGTFYCPFCSYSLAVSEYLEAKRQTSLSKRKLSAFFDIGLEHQPKKHTKRLHSKRQSHSGQNGDDELLPKTHDYHNLGQGECNQANNGDLTCEDNNQEFQNRKHNKQLEPWASCIGVNLPSIEEGLDVNVGRVHISHAEKKGKEMVQECPFVQGLDEQENPICADLKCNSDNIACKYKECVTQRKAGGGIQKEALDCTKLPEEPMCSISNDGGETCDQENDKSTLRYQRREVQYTFPATPQWRRKKVAWTVEEEEVLKGGVQKFSNANDRNIPWRKILEHGRSIFFNSRSTIDLKDKWRNMCRRKP